MDDNVQKTLDRPKEYAKGTVILVDATFELTTGTRKQGVAYAVNVKFLLQPCFLTC